MTKVVQQMELRVGAVEAADLERGDEPDGTEDARGTNDDNHGTDDANNRRRCPSRRHCILVVNVARFCIAFAVVFVLWYQYYIRRNIANDLNMAGKQRLLTAEHFAGIGSHASKLLQRQVRLDTDYDMHTVPMLTDFLQVPSKVEYGVMMSRLEKNVKAIEGYSNGLDTVMSCIITAMIVTIMALSVLDKCISETVSPDKPMMANYKTTVFSVVAITILIGSFFCLVWSYNEVGTTQRDLSSALTAAVEGLRMAPLLTRTSRMNFDCAHNHTACNLTALAIHDVVTRGVADTLMLHFGVYDDFKEIRNEQCIPQYTALLYAHQQGTSTHQQVSTINRGCFESAEWTGSIAHLILSKVESLSEFNRLHMIVIIVNCVTTLSTIIAGLSFMISHRKSQETQATQLLQNELLHQEREHQEQANQRLNAALAKQAEDIRRRQNQLDAEAEKEREGIRRSWFHNQGNTLSALISDLEEPVDLDSARARARHTTHVTEIQRYGSSQSGTCIGQSEDSCDFVTIISDMILLFPQVEYTIEVGKEAHRIELKIKPPLLHTSLYQLIRNAFDHGGRGVAPVLSWQPDLVDGAHMLLIKLWNAPGKNHERMLASDNPIELAKDSAKRKEIGCITSTGQGLVDITKYIKWQGNGSAFDIKWFPEEHHNYGVVATIQVPILRSSIRQSTSLKALRLALIDDESIQRMAAKKLAIQLNPHLETDYKDKASPLHIDAVACKGLTLQHPHIMIGSDGMEGTSNSITKVLEWCALSPRDTVVFMDRILAGPEWLTEALDGVTLIPLFTRLGCTVVMRSGNADDKDRAEYIKAGAFDCIGKTMGGSSGANVIERVRMKLLHDKGEGGIGEQH